MPLRMHKYVAWFVSDSWVSCSTCGAEYVYQIGSLSITIPKIWRGSQNLNIYWFFALCMCMCSITWYMHHVSETVSHFYFYDNFGKRGLIFIISTVKFRKDLPRKLELKLPPTLKSVATLPYVKLKPVQLIIWATVQLYCTVNSVQSD